MPPPAIALPDSSGDSSPAVMLSPAWHQPRRSLSTGTRNAAFHTSRSTAIRDNLINNAEKLQRRVMATVQKMTLIQRILAGIALFTMATLGILFLVFNERIFGWLEPFAEKWKHTTGGWTILWAVTFITAFPPIIGYSTCGTTAGFVYGVWEGWLIFATATVAGSFCSFLVSRTILRRYVERMAANDKRFMALASTLKHDGLKLLWMIRLCPLPYSLTNGAISTIPTVRPATYALATALITPKLFIHVFIGSRLAAIAKSGDTMSAGARAVNWFSIIFGGMAGAFTGWYIYRKTMARAKELEAEEANSVRVAVRRATIPPRQFPDDPEAQVAANTLAHDDDDDVDFFDDETDSDRQKYQDEQMDEEDIFGQGDGEEDEVIGLREQNR